MSIPDIKKKMTGSLEAGKTIKQSIAFLIKMGMTEEQIIEALTGLAKEKGIDPSKITEVIDRLKNE